jgi:hypothetical protein
MPLCPVCNKEFKNVEKHILRMAEKDDNHKNYSLTQQTLETKTTNYKTYQPGDIISLQGKGRFEVVEDLGAKLIIKREASNLIKMTVKKERI